MNIFIFCVSLLSFNILYAQHYKNEKVGELEFTYEVSKPRGQSNLIFVDAVLKNNDFDDVYFLYESCYDLDYYITIEGVEIAPRKLLDCPKILPKKRKLKGGDVYEFNTILKLENISNVENLKLILKFVQLNSGYDLSDKSVKEVIEENQNSVINLEGKLIAFDDFNK